MSKKLAGMVCVVAAGVGITSLFYSGVGEFIFISGNFKLLGRSLLSAVWMRAHGSNCPLQTLLCPPHLAAVAGYLAFPLTARSNITLNFRQDDWLITVARAAIGLIQCCAYPVNHHPARGAVRDFVRQTTGACLGGRAFYVLEPLLFFSATLGLALLCSDLGERLVLQGAGSTILPDVPSQGMHRRTAVSAICGLSGMIACRFIVRRRDP
jgi:hypothetical protein